jgi:hypothetical protein
MAAQAFTSSGSASSWPHDRKRTTQSAGEPGIGGWFRRNTQSHAMIYGHFRPRRHLMTAAEYRDARAKAFRVWRQETCVQMAV